MASTADKAHIRVLYMHGMRSGPGSFKPSVLARHFSAVHTPAMRLSEQSRAAKVQLAFVWLLCCISSLYLTRRLRRFGRLGKALMSLTIGSACAAFGYLPLKHRTVAAMLSNGVEKQREAIRSFQPQVVVASSFGGAIALECLRKGIWSGPTLLLAPAHTLVAHGMGPKGDVFLQRVQGLRVEELPPYCKLHIIHGMADDTVPVADSLELAAQLAGESLPDVNIGSTDLSQGSGRLILTLAEADGHELVRTTEEMLPRLVREIAGVVRM